MRNNALSSLVQVISKLVKRPVKDMLEEDFLGAVAGVAIHTYRANYLVKLNGRKWLAPLYRPVVSTFAIKKGTFIIVRDNNRSVDIEVGGEVYTASAQEWREKEGYFLKIPINRVSGRLGNTVKQILQARKQQNGR